MDVNIYIPHLALQEYVLNISTVYAVLPDGIENVVTPYPPTPFQSLMFYCNHPVSMSREGDQSFVRQPFSLLIGPQLSRVNIKVHRRLRAIRVDFVPGGMFRLFHIPMHILLDEGINAIDLFGDEMRIINERLSEIPDLEHGKIIVEEFLLNQIKTSKSILPFDSAMKILLNLHGNITVEKTAALSCLSLKQFERKCKERIGMNPKMYSRILKFSKAYRLREAFPQMSWIKIAYEAGYYDQMHMIRDFREFADVNPSVIDQQLICTPLRMQRDLLC